MLYVDGCKKRVNDRLFFINKNEVNHEKRDAFKHDQMFSFVVSIKRKDVEKLWLRTRKKRHHAFLSTVKSFFIFKICNNMSLRPSITSATPRDTTEYQSLFQQSCQQIHEQLDIYRWPFCPIYILHINTYCHTDSYAIPAEISLVETTFWPELYGSTNTVQTMNLSDRITRHYERLSNVYKRFCLITNDFHDFVHPGDELPTGYQADILEHSRRTHGLPCTPYEKIGTQDYNQLLDELNEMISSLDEKMPIFCTMESFWLIKAALDWIYDQPTTQHRTDDYTMYPIESLIAVIYENFYKQTQFKCDLGVLMGLETFHLNFKTKFFCF